jgi:hypothetical protein
MNEFVAPHDLVGISIFEESHPNEGGQRFLVISHTAGVTPKGIPVEHRPKGGLFHYEVFITGDDETSEGQLHRVL